MTSETMRRADRSIVYNLPAQSPFAWLFSRCGPVVLVVTVKVRSVSMVSHAGKSDGLACGAASEGAVCKDEVSPVYRAGLSWSDLEGLLVPLCTDTAVAADLGVGLMTCLSYGTGRSARRRHVQEGWTRPRLDRAPSRYCRHVLLSWCPVWRADHRSGNRRRRQALPRLTRQGRMPTKTASVSGRREKCSDCSIQHAWNEATCRGHGVPQPCEK